MCRLVILLLVSGIVNETLGDQPESVRVTEQELWQAVDLDRPELASGRDKDQQDATILKELVG